MHFVWKLTYKNQSIYIFKIESVNYFFLGNFTSVSIWCDIHFIFWIILSILDLIIIVWPTFIFVNNLDYTYDGVIVL